MIDKIDFLTKLITEKDQEIYGEANKEISPEILDAYKTITKRSLEGTIAEMLLWLSGKKAAAVELAQSDNPLELLAKAQAPEKLTGYGEYIKSPVDEFEVDGMQVLSWNDKKDSGQKVILYLHGGGYTLQADSLHLKACDYLAEKLDARIVLPSYPLAPKYTYKDTYPKLEKLYRNLLEQVDSSKQITFAGDSAGSGLSLGLCMYMRDRDMDQPKDVILFSPWLDVNTNNPESVAYEHNDCFIHGPQLYYRGLAWAGSEEDLLNHYVSPLFGSLENITAKITMFIGTYEILYADTLTFSKRLNEEKVEHNLFVYDKMFHIFPIFPIPEGRKALDQTIDVINEEPTL